MSGTSATSRDAPWPPALLAATALIYGPQLAPVASRSLGDVAAAYWEEFIVMPGALAGAFLPQAGELARFAASALATGAIFLLVAQAWRAFDRKGRLVLALLCLAGFTGHAYAFLNALRA